MVDTAAKTEHRLARLLSALDEKSRAVVWHLWWHRHAEIAELRQLIDASGDFEILYRLKEVINGEARKLWGKPAVSFEHSKVDPFSGDKVVFHWWFLDEENVPLSRRHRPLVDVFDEKEYVTVIAQLTTPVDPTPAETQFRNGILKVRLRKRTAVPAGREMDYGH